MHTRGAVLLDPTVITTRWECLKCPVTDVTREREPHTRMHQCGGLGGLETPMVPAGTRGKLVVHEREDYVGDADVYHHGGRPIMSVEVVRDNGNDLAVFAETAYGEGRA
jgi:hypothetical protein